MAVKHEFISKHGLITKELTPTRAIVQKCLDCCNWNALEVFKCPSVNCALHPFRSNTIRKRTSVKTKKYYGEK